MSQNSFIPPWCSGRVSERRKPRKLSHRELKSFRPLWENITKHETEDRRHQGVKERNIQREKLKVFILLLFIAGSGCYIIRERIPTSEIEKLLTQTKLAWTNRNAIGSYIAGARAVKGSTTSEWGGRLGLWGIIPLWRASPPPETILALRQPTPSDCWPFSGSSGELIIHVPHSIQVDNISLEHIRPDTARSAPKDFVVYGILENGTWTKATDGTYRHNKPAKQYFSLDNCSAPLKSIVFQVLSNYGNPKYTCVYRVHLYSRHIDG
ncbi:unnamed protein product [Leptosia nina]|uniref:SUN domain-containing protein n=1 Tax=Leptosia nina TaxID=320188 RepID=A0AAV1JFT9_9NEOP